MLGIEEVMFIVQVDTARVRVDEVEGLLTGRAQASTRVRGVPEKPQEATCGGGWGSI
jgi:hypothetical protein